MGVSYPCDASVLYGLLWYQLSWYSFSWSGLYISSDIYIALVSGHNRPTVTLLRELLKLLHDINRIYIILRFP